MRGSRVVRPVGCPAHGEDHITRYCGWWSTDDNDNVTEAHVSYRCKACRQKFEHDITADDAYRVFNMELD